MHLKHKCPSFHKRYRIANIVSAMALYIDIKHSRPSIQKIHLVLHTSKSFVCLLLGLNFLNISSKSNWRVVEEVASFCNIVHHIANSFERRVIILSLRALPVSPVSQ